jgi:hypothetical protein
MAQEIQRLQLLLAQAVGNLALANKNLAEMNGHSEPTPIPASMPDSVQTRG